MCQRCRKFDETLKILVDKHNESTCEDCAIPQVDAEHSVFFYLAGAVHRIMDTMERIEATKRVVEKPDEVPSQLLADWERHIAEAAALVGKARARRETTEADAMPKNAILSHMTIKGLPS